MSLGHADPENRIIAPVPDKTRGLQGEFITAVYERAQSILVALNAPLIVIGYSFNDHDRASYEPLFSSIQFGNASVIIVSPDAFDITARLSSTFPGIVFIPVKHTLRSWIESKCPGLR